MNQQLDCLCTTFMHKKERKKTLDGLANYINIGTQTHEWFWLKRYMADILPTCPSSTEAMCVGFMRTGKLFESC